VTAIAPVLQSFFTGRLMSQLHASPHTIASYRDTMRLLLAFACQQRGRQPSQLDFTDLDAPVIGAFLTDLETARGNGVTTRNARLVAIHSLFRYASLHVPEHAGLISRVLTIPGKRHDHPTVCFLTREEISALLAAPDHATWAGRRDHALLTVGVQAGLRVSELTGLTVRDAAPGTGPHVTCHGKGRKERATPLTPPPPPSCVTGSPNAAAPGPTPCSRPAAAPASAETLSNASWPSTPPQPPGHARP
jgi:integrase/recombinase XerD